MIAMAHLVLPGAACTWWIEEGREASSREMEARLREMEASSREMEASSREMEASSRGWRHLEARQSGFSRVITQPRHTRARR